MKLRADFHRVNEVGTKKSVWESKIIHKLKKFRGSSIWETK